MASALFSLADMLDGNERYEVERLAVWFSRYPWLDDDAWREVSDEVPDEV